MDFFEMFSARSRVSVTASANFVHHSRMEKPWLNLIRGDLGEIELPIRFEVVGGTNYSDLIETKNSGLFLISERMVRVLSEERLTGWSNFPINLVDPTRRPIAGFAGLSIVGRSGPIDLSKSEIVYKTMFPGAPMARYFKGKYINSDQWDGTDFFLPEGYYGACLSERAATALISNNLSNIEIRKLAEIEVPEFTALTLEKQKRDQK